MSARINIIRMMCVVLLCAGIILMVGTISRVALYTVFVSDDYWHAMNTGIKSGSLIARIAAAWKDNIDLYMTDHGSYSEFFLSLFNPLVSTGFTGLHVIMVFNALFFFCSAAMLVRAILKKVIIEVPLVSYLTILFCIIFVMTQYDAFEQVYYWYTGATNYSFPMSFANTCLAAILGMSEKPKADIKKIVFAVICSIMACGGVIQIGGVLCFTLLAIIIQHRIAKAPIPNGVMLVFGISFIATFVNFIAPGNFVRMDTEGTVNAGLLACFNRTVEYYWYCLRYLFGNKNYLLIFIVLFIVGGCFSYKYRFCREGIRGYAILSVIMLIVPFITIFPVLFGYGSDWMPNRCFFITIYTFDIVLGNIALVLGYICWNIISTAISEKPRKWILGISAVTFIVLAVTNDFSPLDYNIAKINKQLWDGQYQQNYKDVRELIDSFEGMKGQDVIVDVPAAPEEIRNFYTFFLTDNPESVKVNVPVAWRYDLNSISNSRQW